MNIDTNNNGPQTRVLHFDKMRLEIHADRTAMGCAAGTAAAGALREILRIQGNARIIFAAAPSQDECLQVLRESPDIDWSRVTAFHMDEYVGLAAEAPQRFARYLKDRLFDRLPFGTVHLLEQKSGEEPEATAARYAARLAEAPIDLVCLGIGENGHIAFNDPPVADFSDPKSVKVVELDPVCRRQQVNDGCFVSLEDVPRFAITLTIPALVAGRRLVCTVPGRRKHDALRRMVSGPVSTECPASILRNHENCTVFVDNDCWGNDDGIQ